MRSALAETPGWRGSQAPRLSVVPDGEPHPDAEAVLEFADACGVVLDEWQKFVLRVALLRARIDWKWRWAAFSLGLCVPRQNGKNGITEVRELAGPLVLGEELVMHTAHLADTAKEGFRRLDMLLEANEWLSREVRHVRRQNGHEAIEFRNGGRIKFRTRTVGGGRGFSGCSLVIFDEAMVFPEAAQESILPIVSAEPDPQAWYVGSPVDQLIHDHGVVFSRMRAAALAGQRRRAWLEWSVNAESPDSVPESVASDPGEWAVANPALGIRIDPEYVGVERHELGPRMFAVERLGVGDWVTVGATAGPLSLEAWSDLVDDGSRLNDPVCLAFDVSPDRRGSIVAAGRNQRGLLHVEIVESRPGTDWLPGRLAELDERHRPGSVVFAASSPAASLASDIRDAGVPLVEVSVDEHAQACGRLVDLVSERGVRHLGSDQLANAIRGAGTRPFGDAWLWSRRSSSVDISPLVAATLALDAASRLSGGEMVIY